MVARSTWKVEQLAWFKVFVVRWCGITLEIDSAAALPRAGKKKILPIFGLYLLLSMIFPSCTICLAVFCTAGWNEEYFWDFSGLVGQVRSPQYSLCSVSKTTNSYALCLPTPFYQNQCELLRSSIPSYSSCSVGSDHSGQPLIPTCMDEPWPCSLTAVPSLDPSGWIRTTAAWKHLTGATVLELLWPT